MSARAWFVVAGLGISSVATAAWTQTRLVDADLQVTLTPPGVLSVTGTQVLSAAVAGTSGTITWVAYELEVVDGANGCTAPNSPNCSHELHLTRSGGSSPAPDVVLATEPHLFNPSIAILGNQVFVAAQATGTVPCGQPQSSLKVYRHDITGGALTNLTTWTALRSDELGACRTAGHTAIAVDPVHAQVTACATMKSASDDDVWCSRTDTSGASPFTTVLNTPVAGDQDHAWIAFNPTTGDRRAAWHDASAQDDVLQIADGAALTFVAADCATPASPACQRHQQRPSINLGGSQIRLAFEEQVGSDVKTRDVRFGYCPGTTGSACPQASWLWDATAVDPNASDLPRLFPHVTSSCNRVWLRYERQLLHQNVPPPVPSLVQAMVAWRASPATPGGAWTLEDPFPGHTADEQTEEYGTPHITVSGTAIASTVVTVTRALDDTIGQTSPPELDLWVLQEPAPACVP